MTANWQRLLKIYVRAWVLPSDNLYGGIPSDGSSMEIFNLFVRGGSEKSDLPSCVVPVDGS